jgi:hypothetical protein
MRFGTWNVRSLWRSGFLTAAARGLARFKLDLVDVQEVWWDKRGMERAGDYNLFMGKENNIVNWEQGFLHTKDQNQQLTVNSLLAIGCHI